MSDMMTYKGYYGSVSYSAEDKVFIGKVEYIRDLVSYEGTDVQSLEAAFHEAVDDYLQLCKKQGRDPEKPFRGSFNVRTGPALHRRLVHIARARDKNLNTVVVDALQKYVETERV
jgi:predicted HicB family RNase H-like nuclease